jgi:hypothetical protein
MVIQNKGQDNVIGTVATEQGHEGKTRHVSNDHTPPIMRFFLIGVSSIALLYSLGEQLLRTWDESIYAEVAKEMLTRHSWLTLSWNSQPWVDKPPMFMWLTALLYRCFGVSETSSRAVGVLCGVATIWLTFEIGRRLMDDWGGFAAAVILLTNGYFVYASRFEAINVPLTFCLTLGAYGYVRVRQGNPQWWYAIGAATGLAIMLKSAAGLAVPMSIGLALLLDRDFGAIRTRQVRNSAFVACAIALPWHALMVISHGRAFLDPYLGSIFARAQGIDAIPRPVYFYLLVYWHDFAPVAILAIVGLFLHFKGQRNSSIVVSIVLVVTITFSMFGSKLTAYVLPAFPFVSLLAVMAIQRLKTAKYAIACAVIIFPMYWLSQSHFVHLIYGNYGYAGSITSRDDPLMRLLIQGRPSDHDSSPTPLIICIDGFEFKKQQAVFYGDRPVIESFFNAPINDTESSLEKVVTSRPTYIIVRTDTYSELADSGQYNFRLIAQSGPLILGQVSRP